MSVSALQSEFLAYANNKYCQSTVHDQRVVKIDNMLQQSRFTYVLSHKYEVCFANMPAVKLSHVLEPAQRLKDAIEMNTFKLQVPFLFINEFASILDPYYRRLADANDNKIQKVLSYYKRKQSDGAERKKLTKKVGVEHRATMKNIRLNVHTKKHEAPILGQDVLRNGDFTLMKLMEEFRTIKGPSTDARAKLDALSKQKRKFGVSGNDKLLAKSYRKSYADMLTANRREGRRSHADVLEKCQPKCTTYKGSYIASMVSKMSMRSKRFNTITGALPDYTKNEAMLEVNKREIAEPKGFFEISSIYIGSRCDSSMMPQQHVEQPKHARAGQHEGSRTTRQTSVNRDFTDVKRRFNSNGRSPCGESHAMQPSKLKAPKPKAHAMPEACKSPRVGHTAVKVKLPYNKSGFTKSPYDVKSQKLNIIPVPIDVFKKELRLNLISTVSNRQMDKGTGLHSDRTGKHTMHVEFEREMHKSHRPSECRLHRSKERTTGKDSDRTKKADNGVKDFMNSIFKIKRN